MTEYDEFHNILLMYLYESWSYDYNPTINKILFDLKIDSYDVLAFFGLLVNMRKCQLINYVKEESCLRIIRYTLNESEEQAHNKSRAMLSDLLDYYEPLEVIFNG